MTAGDTQPLLPGRPVRVGREKRWVAGIDEALRAVRELGLTDEEEIGAEILRRLGGLNRISEAEAGEFRDAFRREYRAKTPCC